MKHSTSCRLNRCRRVPNLPSSIIAGNRQRQPCGISSIRRRVSIRRFAWLRHGIAESWSNGPTQNLNQRCWTCHLLSQIKLTWNKFNQQINNEKKTSCHLQPQTDHDFWRNQGTAELSQQWQLATLQWKVSTTSAGKMRDEMIWYYMTYFKQKKCKKR